MVIGQLGANGLPALLTVEQESNGGSGPVTIHSQSDLDKIAKDHHLNLEHAMKKNALVGTYVLALIVLQSKKDNGDILIIL